LPDYDYFFAKVPDTAVITTTLNLEMISKTKPALAYLPTTNFYYENVGLAYVRLSAWYAGKTKTAFCY
jgi:hypothetical protein